MSVRLAVVLVWAWRSLVVDVVVGGRWRSRRKVAIIVVVVVVVVMIVVVVIVGVLIADES